MLKKILKIIQLFIISLSILLLLLFSLVSFKLGISSPIFPALEVMFVYYCSTYCEVKYFLIFLFGIFFDQIYGMPIGTSSFSFLIATITLTYTSKWLSLKDCITNLTVFSCYCALIFFLRYCVLLYKLGAQETFSDIVLQYLTTTLSYPIVRFLLNTTKAFVHTDCQGI